MSNKSSQRRTVETSAGGVVVRPTENGWKVLVIRDPYGKWGLPKGHIEGQETPSEAAVREVAEETGIDGVVVGPLVEKIDWFFRRDGDLIHKFCSFFLMKSEQADARPQLTEGITECEWVPLDEGAARIAYENTKGVVRRAAGLLQEQGW